MSLCKYLSPFAVTTANDTCFVEGTVSNNSNVASGSYYITGDGSATDLLAACKAAWEATTGDTWTLTLSGGVVTISCNIGWAVEFDTETTALGAALGFDVDGSQASINALAGVGVAALFQHQHGWYSTQYVADDTLATKEAHVSQSVAASGAVWTVRRGDVHSVRTVAHAFEPVYKAHPTTGYTHQDWLTWWATANSGQRVRYYPDASAAAYFDGVLDEATASEARPERMAPGVALYSWPVGLRGYVS